MITVTAPTSQIGRQVLSRLLDADTPIRVIARDPSRLAPEILERVDVVTGSHGDPDVVQKAFDGTDAVFWLIPPNPAAPSIEAAFVDFTRPAVDALKQGAGVGRVVGISALGRGTAPVGQSGYVAASLATDDLIASSGVSYRALAMPSFMDNTARQVQLIKTQGLFTSPISGNRKRPTCATRDIAAVAAGLLLDPTWSGVAEVSVLGPEDLSFDDQAEIMSDVLQRPVRYQQVPGEAFKDRMMQFGTSEPMAQGLLDMYRAKDEGLDNGVARTAENSTPTTFRQWCEDTLKPAVLA